MGGVAASNGGTFDRTNHAWNAIRGSTAADGALFNNRQFTRLRREAGIFTGTIRPPRGTLSINIEVDYIGQDSYWQVLSHEVR